MGFFDKFKRKKEEVKIAEPASDVSDGKPREKEPVIASVYGGKQVLVRPLLTEKGTSMAGSGRYVFAVYPKANKPEIKKAVQKIYNVHVDQVKILNMPAKKRQYGRTRGETSTFKKAIVVLRAGEKIPGIIESVG